MKYTNYNPNITDYINVKAQLSKLGCHEPSGLAILPSNFESANSIDELLQPMESATVKKLLILNELPYTDILERNNRPKYVTEKSIDLILPTIFISAALLSENPAAVSLALNIIANYATEFFRGMKGERKVKIDFVTETPEGCYKKLSIECPPESVKEVMPALKELIRE